MATLTSVPRNRFTAVLAAVLISLIVAAAAFVVRDTYFRPKTITADFTAAIGIYPGDDVRVSGIKVGRIASIQPQGTRARMTLNVDRDVPIPADAKAVIVAQNLVAARYVQLAPAYEDAGPTMADGATIPLDRTAVPVEWDEIKTQLSRLATDLGPTSSSSATSLGRFIDSTANALVGNGDKLRDTLAQLSTIGRVLAEGRGNIVDIIKNLQTFVTTLRDSSEQIVQFQNRLATLSSVLNDSRSELDAALTNLSVAVGDVQRFIAGTRDKTAEQIQRLANVTQTLADQQMTVKNILHAAPTAFANAYNIYNPNVPGAIGTFIINGLSDPMQFVCGSVGALETATSTETAKLCAQYFGPALSSVSLNYVPFPFNPFLQRTVTPDKITYAEPRLAPGGEGPRPNPPEPPPVVSAYTGLNNDQPPPPGYVPAAPITSVDQLLLPAEAPQSSAAPPPPAAPDNGTPP